MLDKSHVWQLTSTNLTTSSTSSALKAIVSELVLSSWFLFTAPVRLLLFKMLDSSSSEKMVGNVAR